MGGQEAGLRRVTIPPFARSGKGRSAGERKREETASLGR